jgi:diamine N-acetyltransferase
VPDHASLEPLCHPEIPAIEALAKTIWREHHAKFISAAQIEYMLRGKYTSADLGPFIGAADRWLDVLRVDGAPCGFLRCLQTSPRELKIAEIYLSGAQRRKGLGRMMLDHAEARARRLGCSTLVLYVNQRNDTAVGAYRQFGFVVTEETIIDIGNGFVMDDYRMEKLLLNSPAA